MPVLQLLESPLKLLWLLDCKFRLKILQNSHHLTNQLPKLPVTALIFLPLKMPLNTYLFVKSSYLSSFVPEEIVLQIYRSWVSVTAFLRI